MHLVPVFPPLEYNVLKNGIKTLASVAKASFLALDIIGITALVAIKTTTDKITIRIPRTKAGKTEEDDYNKEKIIEEYGIEPKALIEVKGLMGDKSDNIPGIAGIGEKTALGIIQKYKSIEKLYEKIENRRSRRN